MTVRFLFIAFILLSNTAAAQVSTLYGKISDTQGKRLPYALIFPEEDPTLGTYTDEQGYFSLKLEKDKEYNLVVKAAGYTDYTFNYTFQTDSLYITMQRKDNPLRGVTITARRGNIITGVLGKKNINNHIAGGRFNGRTYNEYGDEQAIWLAAEEGGGLLKEVFFFVTEYGIPTSKFRIHVYELSPSALAPGKELTDSNIIVQATRGNRWVSADLSSLNIVVKRGVFVSVEWIDGHGNDPYPWSDRTTTKSQGQVMGLTDGYWRRGNITFKRKVYEKEWWQSNLTPAYRKNMLNLMAYATYTYYE